MINYLYQISFSSRFKKLPYDLPFQLSIDKLKTQSNQRFRDISKKSETQPFTKTFTDMNLESLISQYSPINSEAKIKLLLSDLINHKLFNLKNKFEIHLHIKKRKSQEYFLTSWDKFEKKLLRKRPFNPNSSLHQCPGCKAVFRKWEIRSHKKGCYFFEQYLIKKLCVSSNFHQNFLNKQIDDSSRNITTQRIRHDKQDAQPAVRRVVPLRYYTSENDEDVLHQ